MSQAADQHMLVPGDPDQWWSVPGVPSATIDPPGRGEPVDPDGWWSEPVLPSAPIEQAGPVEPAALACWLSAIVQSGGPVVGEQVLDARTNAAKDAIETAVTQALGAAWRSSSARAEEVAGTGEQPEVQRHIDIVIDGLTNRDKSIVSDRDRPRLRKALDDAEKPLAGRPGADAGVGRAIRSAT